MALVAADVVARARVLWPALTESAAPDAVALAWVTAAEQLVGTAYKSLQFDATAHALAHFMYRLDPVGELGTGGAGTGAVGSLRTGNLSVGFQGSGAGRSGSDADLELTRPGQTLLMLRSTLPATLPRWIS